jgi:hypothetical protein
MKVVELGLKGLIRSQTHSKAFAEGRVLPARDTVITGVVRGWGSLSMGTFTEGPD